MASELASSYGFGLGRGRTSRIDAHSGILQIRGFKPLKQRSTLWREKNRSTSA